MLLSKFGLLSSITVRQVIDVHVSIEQFCDKLLAVGGDQAGNYVKMPGQKAQFVAELARDIAKKIDRVIETLGDLKI